MINLDSYIGEFSEIIDLNDKYLLPKKPGIYKFYDDKDELMYIGKTQDIRGRIDAHLHPSKETKFVRSTANICHNFKKVSYMLINCPADRDILETYLINRDKPKLNGNKVFIYQTDRGLRKYMSKEALEHEERGDEWRKEGLKCFKGI
jgi:hypothetical protein